MYGTFLLWGILPSWTFQQKKCSYMEVVVVKLVVVLVVTVFDCRFHHPVMMWSMRATLSRMLQLRTALTTLSVVLRRRVASPSSLGSTSWQICCATASLRPASQSVSHSHCVHATTLQQGSNETSPTSAPYTSPTQRLLNFRLSHVDLWPGGEMGRALDLSLLQFQVIYVVL